VLIYNQSVLVSAGHLAARKGVSGGINKPTSAEVAQLAIDDATKHLMLIANGTVVSAQVVQATPPVFQLPLRVTVQYTYQGFLLGGLFSALQLQPTLQSTAVMYNE